MYFGISALKLPLVTTFFSSLISFVPYKVDSGKERDMAFPCKNICMVQDLSQFLITAV